MSKKLKNGQPNKDDFDNRADDGDETDDDDGDGNDADDGDNFGSKAAKR